METAGQQRTYAGRLEKAPRTYGDAFKQQQSSRRGSNRPECSNASAPTGNCRIGSAGIRKIRLSDDRRLEYWDEDNGKMGHGSNRRTEAEKLSSHRFYHLPRTLWGAYQAAMADPIVGFQAFRHLSDEAWIDTIIKSLSTPIIEGVRFAGFTDEPFKKGSGFVSTTDALREAGQFYCHVKKYVAARLSVLISNALCWTFVLEGDTTRDFFPRDTNVGNIYGVDVWPLMIELCRTLMVPASVSLIEPLGQLPRSTPADMLSAGER